MNYFHMQIVNLCFMAVNQEFKNLINRIKYEYSLNQSQIADRLGVKKTYLSDMINGRVPYNETMNKKINDVFPLPPMNKVHIQKEDTLEISTSDIKEGDYSGTLVYYMDETCGTYGRDIYFTQEDIIGSVNLPGINKESKIIRANGDSMEPKVYDGNMVVIREIHNWDDIFYGQMYLILLDEYRMIKYIRRYEQDETNYIILRSENPLYDDIKLHKNKIRKLFVVENVLSVKTQL